MGSQEEGFLDDVASGGRGKYPGHMSVSQTEGGRQLPPKVRLAILLAGSAALTVALAHLGYEYLRLGEGFARLVLH